MRDDSLANLVRFHNQLQRLRIAQGNRAFAARELDKVEEAELHSSWHADLHTLEKQVEKQYKGMLDEQPGWDWMKRIRGVGELLSAAILSEVDFERADTISALWRYAGLGVKDGKREYPTKGEKLPYNKELKKKMYLFAVTQLRSKGPYGPYYYEAKEKYQGRTDEEGKAWTKSHIHYASLRIPQKLFLQHLWVVAREQLGLSTSGPWIEEYGGRPERRIDPWSLVEPE